jgi:hypothetical protein
MKEGRVFLMTGSFEKGRAIAQVAGFPPRRPGFASGSGQVGFVVDKVKLEQVFSEYRTSVSNVNLHSTKFSILTITRGKYKTSEVADVPNGPSLGSTPPPTPFFLRIKKKSLQERLITNGDVITHFH